MWAKQGKKKEASRCKSRIQAKKSSFEREKKVKRAERSKKIKKTEMLVFSLIKLLILHLHLHLHNLYLATLFSTYLLYYTVALDSGNEAKYVYYQGRNLRI